MKEWDTLHVTLWSLHYNNYSYNCSQETTHVNFRLTVGTSLHKSDIIMHDGLQAKSHI